MKHLFLPQQYEARNQLQEKKKKKKKGGGQKRQTHGG